MSIWPSIEKLADSVNKGEVLASNNVKKAHKLIEQHKEFNAVVAVIGKRALDRAKVVDDLVKSGKNAGKLAGVPFIAKDNFLTFGSETTAASNILKGFEAPYQATAIELLESEGAICVAKANLDAFAHGSSTENSDIFTTKNPHDKSKVPGGSSGGSAAAVVLDMAPFALGTDTGGSIRLPASFCGAVGYKPTYGLVSRNGVIAMASSTDVIGPLTKTVEDAAYVLDIIAGRDQLDSTTIEKPVTSFAINGEEPQLKGLKIGIVKEYLGKGVDPEINGSILNTVKKLEDAGAKISEISLPSIPYALACYYIICPAEVSSNLSRYDGQRYGYSSKTGKSLDESYVWSRTEGFGDEAKRRIMIGTYVLSSGYYDAYYKKAQKLRTKLIDEFKDAFSKFDFLLGPTAPTTAFEIGANTGDPLTMYLSDIMTVAANLTGVPSISLPCGLSADKLPIGLQLMAPQKKDKELLELSAKTERILK